VSKNSKRVAGGVTVRLLKFKNRGDLLGYLRAQGVKKKK
jgi:hypothetical protein